MTIQEPEIAVAKLIAALQRFVWDQSAYTQIKHGVTPQVWYCKYCTEEWLATEPDKHLDGCRIKQARNAIAKAKGEPE